MYCLNHFLGSTTEILNTWTEPNYKYRAGQASQIMTNNKLTCWQIRVDFCLYTWNLPSNTCQWNIENMSTTSSDLNRTIQKTNFLIAMTKSHACSSPRKDVFFFKTKHMDTFS